MRFFSRAKATIAPPTAAQLANANMAPIPNPNIIVTENGKQVRGWNGKNFVIPTTVTPGQQLYAVPGSWVAVVPPPPPPPVTKTFTATASGTSALVSWSGAAPTQIGRNGKDSTGGGPWNTGTLTGQPASGSFTFTLLIPGATYTFTITFADGSTMTATATVPAVAPPVVTTALQVGINNTGTVIWDMSTNAAQCAQAKTLGAKFGRTSIPWNCNQGSSQWPTLFTSTTDLTLNPVAVARIKALKADAEAAGIQMIFCMVGYVGTDATAPTIANNLYLPGMPYTPQAYANIYAQLVAAIPGLWLSHINEWDLYEYSYDANHAITVAAYAELLQLTYPLAKKADPTCKVLSGPLANINAGNDDGYADLNALYTLLPNWYEYVDIEDVHGDYAWPKNLSAATAGVVGWFNTWLALRAAKGNTLKWIISEGGFQSLTTSSGDSSPEMTPALQATYLVQLIQLLEPFTAQGLIGFLIYCLGEDDYWGLIDSNGVNKPAFAAVQTLLAQGA